MCCSDAAGAMALMSKEATMSSVRIIMVWVDVVGLAAATAVVFPTVRAVAVVGYYLKLLET